MFVHHVYDKEILCNTECVMLNPCVALDYVHSG